MEALLGVIGIRNIWRKNYRDMGYLGGKLKGFGTFKKDSGISKIEVLMFQKNEISLLVNIEDEKKNFQMRFLHFAIKYCQYWR